MIKCIPSPNTRFSTAPRYRTAPLCQACTTTTDSNITMTITRIVATTAAKIFGLFCNLGAFGEVGILGISDEYSKNNLIILEVQLSKCHRLETRTKDYITIHDTYRRIRILLWGLYYELQ